MVHWSTMGRGRTDDMSLSAGEPLVKVSDRIECIRGNEKKKKEVRVRQPAHRNKKRAFTYAVVDPEPGHRGSLAADLICESPISFEP